MKADAEPLLSMRRIVKSFGGVRALRGVDFELRAGEVHALLGENGAGKSTLMNVLAGVITPDDGQVTIAGETQDYSDPAGAQAAGVAMIHQELDLVPPLTVAENLYLGREPRTRLGTLDHRRMVRDARGFLERMALPVDPARKVGSLRVGEQQLVEIGRALSLDARVLIMDEPSSALADAEVDRLLSVIRDLREHGVGIIYISHRLEEISVIADRATVLRDGERVGTVDVTETPPDEIIRMMVGQPMEALFPDTDVESGKPVLQVERLTVRERRSKRARSEPKDISLTVQAGEIVGLAGLMGAGRTELLETLFGVGSSKPEGRVTLNGEPVELASPRAAIDAGVGFVPEDRRAAALVMQSSVGMNISLSALPDIAPGGLLRRGKEQERVDGAIRDLQVRTPHARVLVNTLSGGNQQKVVFARHLLHQPSLLLLDDPTRGVDVGAKAEIYRLLASVAADGMAVLLASSELPELLGICHRILVLRDGRIVAEFRAEEATQEAILQAASLGADSASNGGGDEPQEPQVEVS